eukprot:TRINITY_DN7586_c0_g1_i1.p1 TRINITY_DN7586_c0_g1~~TRINITY_DN7586_c0_g1_i1.p1  ORF type:complete len:382 (-),score=43.76 TRINITY_DN7586_c0_g1_i1:124-1269(-)
MGETGPLDIERKGSLEAGRNNPGMVHPMPNAVPYYETRARSERRWNAWIIILFVIINIAVFVVTMFVNDCPKKSQTGCTLRFLGRFSFQPLSENSLFGPSSSTLEKMGALVWNKVVKDHQGWRLVTCVWLHAGVIHLLVNMLSLLFIGIRLEQEFGFARIGVVYLVSAFGGSIMSALFNQNGVSVGASGALFGLLGAMLSELITNWTIYSNKIAALVTLIFIIAVNLAFGLLPHVDNFAHIGGFISGFLLGFVFLVRPQFGWRDHRNGHPGNQVFAITKSRHSVCQYALGIFAFVLLVIGFTLGLVMLFRGVNANDHCKWCHYLDCIPTDKWNCNDNVICQEVSTDTNFTLTCQSNGKSAVYQDANASEEKKRQLCSKLCS